MCYLTGTGLRAATLDGHPYAGNEALSAGDHQFVPADAGPVTLFWARAWNRGYKPGAELKN